MEEDVDTRAREDDPEFQSPVDLMFQRLEEKDPEHFAVRQYKKFLLSAGKTRSSILISCGARLAPFDIRELRELLEKDEMELDTIGDRKMVLFVIISDTDDTFNFAATAVLDIAGTKLAISVPWLGSTITGKCVMDFNNGTAVRSNVYLVISEKVRIPRSHKITFRFPSAKIYSALFKNSSIVAELPRFNITGLLNFPTALSNG